jgi:DNA-binding response OmpR family regulator
MLVQKIRISTFSREFMLLYETLLIIDDDEKLNGLLTEYLGGFGYRIQAAITASDGMASLKKFDPHLVILDVMLPEKNGFDVCRDIRQISDVPIIMLTARGEVTDRVVGLEMGADDYLPKPFEPRELVARIQSVLRRRAGRGSTVIRAGELEVNLEKHTVSIKGRNIDLTTMEFELLALFVRNPGRVLTRDLMMDELRGIDWTAFDRSMDVLLSRLRQKLGDDPKHPKWIRTLRGSGYKFIGAET